MALVGALKIWDINPKPYKRWTQSPTLNWGSGRLLGIVSGCAADEIKLKKNFAIFVFSLGLGLRAVLNKRVCVCVCYASITRSEWQGIKSKVAAAVHTEVKVRTYSLHCSSFFG